MARLAMCGWESGVLAELGPSAIISGSEVMSTTARTGSYAWQVTVNPAYVSSPGYVFFGGKFIGNPSEIWIRCAVKVSTVLNVNGAAFAFLSLMDGVTRQISFGYSHVVPGILQVYRGTTLIASGGTLPSANYICFEARVVIHNSTGVVQVWLNGVQVINFTGDTMESATAQIADFQLGLIKIVAGTVSQAATDIATLDDFAINDTTGSVNNGRIGQGGIFPLYPNADTADKDFSRSAGSDNYSLVNSFPPDGDTTYVEAGTIGDLDLYQHQQIGGAGTVDAVWLTLNGRVVNGAGATIQPTIKSVATTVVGSPIYLVNTYATQGALFETDPNGNIPWTATAINSALIGMTVV